MIAGDPTALLALDWGTTSARAYRVGPTGRVLAERSGPLGIQHVETSGFSAALAHLLGDWRELQVPRLACGMIGSRQGWIEAPYRRCPIAIRELASSIVRTPQQELAIVPGVTCRDDAGVPDVMRGEETQVAGLLDWHDIASALVIQPGTHSKWTLVRDDAIAVFASYMTGETFAVLREHSILGRLMERESAPDETSFAHGVRRGLAPGSAGELLHRAFGARTLGLFGELPGSGIADYLSGLLIGAEIGAGQAWAARHRASSMPVWLLGSAELCARYRTALALSGSQANIGPPEVAARGLWRLAVLGGMVTETV